MRESVICIASDLGEATKLIQSLKNVGFTADDISVLMPDKNGAQELGYEKHSKGPEGFSFGVCAGALIGGALSYLVGSGALWIPAGGTVIVGDPMAALLSGAAVGGAIGGLTGTLIGLGMPEFEAKKYERKIKRGSTLIAVHIDTNKEARVAEETFRNAGAADLHRIAEDGVRRVKSA